MSNSLKIILQDNHLAAWNERNREQRDQLLSTIYADSIEMHDAGLTVKGRKAISDFIGKLHAEDDKFYFSALSPIEFIHNGGRFFGKIQTKEGILNSMDFFVVENDKVVTIYAFLSPAS
jgi:hypothetical protein